ncbi:MAG: restriction endonuclease subunit S [Mucilaginibacter sp.]|uniref:restriction endonuclease subunit S n=1 Tax=Mucilaginibacter sp. TaxID=1882438 RepID=UPI0034E573AE
MEDKSIYKLGDVCDLITDGKHGDCQDEENSGYYFLSAKDVFDGKLNYERGRQITKADFLDTHRRTRLSPGDILITNSGSIGRMAIAQDQPLTHQTTFQKSVAILKPKSSIVFGQYLYYELLALNPILIDIAVGSAQTNLLLGDLRKFKISVPNLIIQKHIASILSAYDELIEVNNQRIQVLEETARQLYKEWFVRMRFPGYKNAKFEKGIPEGWEVKSLYEIAEVTYGYPFKSELFNENSQGLPVIRIRDLLEGATNTYTPEIADDKYYVLDGDILVGMDGEFHFCKWAGVKAWINQRNVRFRPKLKTDISKYFLYHVLKPQIEFLNEIIVGTTVAHLSALDLKKLRFLIPQKELLKRFKLISDPIFEQEIILKKQNTQLRQIRDRLLPRLISGKLKVKAATEELICP